MRVEFTKYQPLCVESAELNEAIVGVLQLVRAIDRKLDERKRFGSEAEESVRRMAEQRKWLMTSVRAMTRLQEILDFEAGAGDGKTRGDPGDDRQRGNGTSNREAL